MAQGKCVRCRIRWTWNGSPLLRDAYCPDCGSKLYQTTYRLRWPVREEQPQARETAKMTQAVAEYRCPRCTTPVEDAGLCVGCYDRQVGTSDDVKARRREYKQRDDVKARKREYMREYNQRDDVKARRREAEAV